MLLAKLLAEAGQWTRAEALAHTLDESRERSEALQWLVSCLSSAGQLQWAETIANSIEDQEEKDKAFQVLSLALAEAHNWDASETIARARSSNSLRDWTLQAWDDLFADLSEQKKILTLTAKCKGRLDVQALYSRKKGRITYKKSFSFLQKASISISYRDATRIYISACQLI